MSQDASKAGWDREVSGELCFVCVLIRTIEIDNGVVHLDLLKAAVVSHGGWKQQGRGERGQTRLMCVMDRKSDKCAEIMKLAVNHTQLDVRVSS